MELLTGQTLLHITYSSFCSRLKTFLFSKFYSQWQLYFTHCIRRQLILLLGAPERRIGSATADWLNCGPKRKPIRKQEIVSSAALLQNRQDIYFLRHWSGWNLTSKSIDITCSFLPNFTLIAESYRRYAGRETPNFTAFWNLTFSGGATWRHSEKLECMCTATNLPLSNVNKTFLII